MAKKPRKRVSLQTRDLMRAFEDAVYRRAIGAVTGKVPPHEYRQARAVFIRHLVELESKAGAS